MWYLTYMYKKRPLQEPILRRFRHEEEDIEDHMYWWPCHGLWVDGGGLELWTWDMDEGERRRVVSKTMGLHVYKSKEAVPRWIRKCFYCLRQCFLNWNTYEKHCHWISRLYWSGSAMRGRKIIGNSRNHASTPWWRPIIWFHVSSCVSQACSEFCNSSFQVNSTVTNELVNIRQSKSPWGHIRPPQ